MTSNPTPSESGSRSSALARDFVVDFLASLVPGVAFMLGVLVGIIYPAHYALHRLVSAENPEEIGPLFSFADAAVVSICLAISLLILSYIVGHVFYRQDPKTPDEKGARRIWNRIQSERGDTDEREGPDENAGTTGPRAEKYALAIYAKRGEKPDVQFPYLYLYEFLMQRGLNHLAKHVRWRGEHPETHSLRSKHFINALKIRIELCFPDSYGRIARNEAHVRLMASMWYASRALAWLSGAGLGLAIVALILAGTASVIGDHALALPIVVILASLAIKRGIESTLLYQRQREIVFVLETASWLNRQSPNLGLFENLSRESAQSTDSEGT